MYPIACKSSEPSIRATHIKVPAFFASVNVGRTPDTLCSRPYVEEQKNAWEPEAPEDRQVPPGRLSRHGGGTVLAWGSTE